MISFHRARALLDPKTLLTSSWQKPTRISDGRQWRRGGGKRMELDPLLRLEKVAEALDMSLWTVRAWIQQVRLPSVKVGNLRRVRQSVVGRVIERGLPAARDEESDSP